MGEVASGLSKLRIGRDLCLCSGGTRCFVFFFASDQQGCVRWYVLECLWEACLLVIGIVFGLACYLGEASCTGRCWELGDAGSYRRRPTGEFSLINTLWGQEFSGSLVSWTQRFHSKGSGQISSQVTKVPQSTC